jgi:hypothetical protein
MSPDPALKPNPVYGKPEKRSPIKIILFGLFVILAIGGIAWMMMSVPREGTIVCRSDAPASLIGFGTCTEE